MAKGGRKSTSFKPGQSGNPHGRPTNSELVGSSKTRADVRELAKEKGPLAIETLASIMIDIKAPPAARVGAATAILDRGYGKPPQTIDANVNIFDQMTDEEQKTLLAAMAAIREAAEEDPPETLN
jgi:hypothetical protein